MSTPKVSATNSENRAFLGDSLYATFDGYHVILTSEKASTVTDIIYLNPNVVAQFASFARRMGYGNQLDAT